MIWASRKKCKQPSWTVCQPIKYACTDDPYYFTIFRLDEWIRLDILKSVSFPGLDWTGGKWFDSACADLARHPFKDRPDTRDSDPQSSGGFRAHLWHQRGTHTVVSYPLLSVWLWCEQPWAPRAALWRATTTCSSSSWWETAMWERERSWTAFKMDLLSLHMPTAVVS